MNALSISDETIDSLPCSESTKRAIGKYVGREKYGRALSLVPVIREIEEDGVVIYGS